MATKQPKTKPVAKPTAADKLKAKAAAVRPSGNIDSKKAPKPAPKVKPAGKPVSVPQAVESIETALRGLGLQPTIEPPPLKTRFAQNTHQAASDLKAALNYARSVTDFTREDAWEYMFSTVVNTLIGSPAARRLASPYVVIAGDEPSMSAPQWRRVSLMSTPMVSAGLSDKYRRYILETDSWGLRIEAWLPSSGVDVHVLFSLRYNCITGMAAVFVPDQVTGDVDLDLSNKVAQVVLLTLGTGTSVLSMTRPEIVSLVTALGIFAFNDLKPARPPAPTNWPRP